MHTDFAVRTFDWMSFSVFLVYMKNIREKEKDLD